MVAGESGVSGLTAPLVVQVETNRELGYVTALLQNIEAMTVQLMVHRIQKPKHVTKTLAQVSVVSLGAQIILYFGVIIFRLQGSEIFVKLFF